MLTRHKISTGPWPGLALYASYLFFLSDCQPYRYLNQTAKLVILLLVCHGNATEFYANFSNVVYSSSAEHLLIAVEENRVTRPQLKPSHKKTL